MDSLISRFLVGVLALLPTAAAFGAATPVEQWRPKVRWCGFNLLGMFKKRIPAERTESDPTWSRSPGYFPEEDFRWMRDWGFNFARLPLDYRIWAKEGDWTEIDAEAVKPIDEALAFGLRYGIHIQLCFHRAPGYCTNPPDEPGNLFTDPSVLEICARHWAFFARRYRDLPNDRLSFDLVNEPPGKYPEETVVRAFRRLIGAIRAEDPKRFIIMNGCRWGRLHIGGFEDVPNVGQSMRGYLPFSVSHYKAEWDTPPDALPTWPPQGFENGQDWLFRHVFAEWQPALQRGEFIMSNEFGCYRFTPHELALKWMEDYLAYWKKNEIGWALWNLRGRFGIMDSEREDVEYESFEGHKLDRKMLDLLRKYL